MNAQFSKKFIILLALLVGLSSWSCGDRAEDADKEISVRKEIVLPPEDSSQTDTAAVSSPIDSKPKPTAEDKALPEETQASSQMAAVTKKVPSVPSQSAEDVEISAPIGVETDQNALPESDEAQDEASELSEEETPDEKAVPDETLADAKPAVTESVDTTTGAAPEKKPEVGTVTEDLSLAEQPSEEAEPSEEVDIVPAGEEPGEVTDEETDDSEVAIMTESGSPASETGVSDSALASILGITKKDQKKTTGYDASGKVDPFEPLFKEEEDEPPPEEEPVAEEDTTASKPKKKKRIPRTPLEKMDLNQLKLVGVIRAPSGNRALVEEASGKGYIISKGTYIGIHSGKVSEILKDRVIVEEEYEDIRGEITVRKRELKIQRPPGEGFHEM